MKKKTLLLKTFVLSVFYVLSFCTSGQGNFFLLNSTDSVYASGCDASAYISIYPVANIYETTGGVELILEGSNYQDGPLIVTIDWGDLTTTTHNSQMIGAGVEVTSDIYPTHNYTASGTYLVNINVLNPVNNSQINHSVSLNIQLCNTYISPYRRSSCLTADPNLVYGGCPWDIVNSSGDTTTVWIDYATTYQAYLDPGIYSINVSEEWASENGLELNGPNPSIFEVLPGSNCFTAQSIFYCTSMPSDMNCVTGLLFCDENNNGVFDNCEPRILGTNQVIADVDGVLQTLDVSTDSYYYLEYPINTQNVSLVANQAYLDEDGSVAGPVQTVSSHETCSQGGNVVNIPVACYINNGTSYCVNGMLYCDENNNGVRDSNEVGFVNAPIVIQNSNLFSIIAYTDLNGYFNLVTSYLEADSADVFVDPNWLSQNGYQISGNSVQTAILDCGLAQPLEFSIFCDPTLCTDFVSYILPFGSYFQNQTNFIEICYGNLGLAADMGYTVSISFPPDATPDLSTFNLSGLTVANNTVSWIASPIAGAFFECETVGFSIPGGLVDGSLHNYEITITPNNFLDCDLSNNSYSSTFVLGNSYDPNDKTSNLPDIISPYSQEEFIYRIRFQNTGTAPAQDIFIIDTLSPNLDWSTFELLSSTHNIQVFDLGNGVIKFNFSQIWLPDSTSNLEESQGALSYRIKENIGNVIGTEIENTAYIYFDWNPAIITNTVHSENNILAIQELEDVMLEIFPNPTKDYLNLRTNGKIKSVKIFDLTGNLILEERSDNVKTVMTHSLVKGVYLIDVMLNNNRIIKKIVKQ